jgi:hypothetical protein
VTNDVFRVEFRDRTGDLRLANNASVTHAI